jgi:ABC-type oligopeptide transport system substrate-binding subunit
MEATFVDDVHAEFYVASGWGGFDVGPFRVAQQEPGRVKLRRRGQTAIELIDIVELSANDEWRQFMGRRLDVIPAAPEVYRSQFEDMRSVRILDIPPSQTIALFFNLQDSALAEREARRAIACSLNRSAIGTVVCGDAACATRDPMSSCSQTPERKMPMLLSLVVAEGESATVRAAEVIRHELRSLRMDVLLEPVAIEDYIRRREEQKYHLLLGPLPFGKRGHRQFLSADHPDSQNLSGYANPDYDAAYDRGDVDTLQTILDRDVPAVPLYVSRSFAAIDGSFCGDVVPSATSWRWMADLRPCQPGESP